MTSYQTNNLKRLYGLELFLDENLDTLKATASALIGLTARLKAVIVSIVKNEIIAGKNTTGSTADKKKARIAMRMEALIISGGLQSYFTSEGEKALVKQAKVLDSTLNTVAESKALLICDELFILAGKYADAIKDFGITTAKLESFGAKTDIFRQFLSRPKNESEVKVAAGQSVDEKFKEAEEILKIIDGIMQTFAIQFKDEHDRYFVARGARHSRSGKVQPKDTIKTLLPHSRTVVFTITHLETLRLKAQNNGLGYVFWGLGTKADTYSGKFFTIAKGAKSIRLCKTFAPEGNLVIFENPNDFKVEIELTVLKE